MMSHYIVHTTTYLYHHFCCKIFLPLPRSPSLPKNSTKSQWSRMFGELVIEEHDILVVRLRPIFELLMTVMTSAETKPNSTSNSQCISFFWNTMFVSFTKSLRKKKQKLRDIQNNYHQHKVKHIHFWTCLIRSYCVSLVGISRYNCILHHTYHEISLLSLFQSLLRYLSTAESLHGDRCLVNWSEKGRTYLLLGWDRIQFNF